MAPPSLLRSCGASAGESACCCSTQGGDRSASEARGARFPSAAHARPHTHRRHIPTNSDHERARRVDPARRRHWPPRPPPPRRRRPRPAPAGAPSAGRAADAPALLLLLRLAPRARDRGRPPRLLQRVRVHVQPRRGAGRAPARARRRRPPLDRAPVPARRQVFGRRAALHGRRLARRARLLARVCAQGGQGGELFGGQPLSLLVLVG